MLYAEILLDRKVGTQSGKLTYEIPPHLENNLKAGDLVEIPLRKQKVAGIIWKTGEKTKEKDIQFKAIEKILQKNMIPRWQRELLDWLSMQPKGKIHLILKKMVPAQILKQKITLEEFKKVPEEPGEMVKKETSEKEKSPKQKTLFICESQTEKWELLLRKIEKVVKEKKQVLILIPEIDPVPPIFEILSQKAATAIYHGKYTEKQRALLWKKIAEGSIKIIVASKLGPFAPLRGLGLIILTHEQNNTYLEDNRPFISTRDTALKLAELKACEIIIESPFPSLETFERAQKEHWNIVEKKHTVKISLVDLKEEQKKGNFSLISETLQEKITDTLQKNEQIILFLNRRGTSSALLCKDCGHIERCTRCETPLVLHRKNILLCHQCRFQKTAPLLCPHCSSSHIKLLGTGTEKIEQEIRKLFPQTSLIRIDKDAISNPKELDEASKIFRSCLAKILIGTSLIRPELMPQVAVCAALLSDMALAFPSEKSNEQTLEQLALLKSMTKTNGELLIQTYLPEHSIYKGFKTENRMQFYHAERIAQSFLLKIAKTNEQKK